VDAIRADTRDLQTIAEEHNINKSQVSKIKNNQLYRRADNHNELRLLAALQRTWQKAKVPTREEFLRWLWREHPAMVGALMPPNRNSRDADATRSAGTPPYDDRVQRDVREPFRCDDMPGEPVSAARSGPKPVSSPAEPPSPAVAEEPELPRRPIELRTRTPRPSPASPASPPSERSTVRTRKRTRPLDPPAAPAEA
jgi:hypothetical protein